jgi:hypothetical protein
MKAYLDKGRVAPILDSVPLFAVTTEDLGVRGAYKCAMMVSQLHIVSTVMFCISFVDHMTWLLTDIHAFA